jgi:hypothetical protein
MLEVEGDSFAPGALIAGQFLLERPIGQGGMGAVWAARDGRGALVALKVARPDKPGDAKQVERLRREARAASLVRHPNVVPVLAVVDTQAGLPCLVMPLLEGESLRALFARRGALPWPECVRLFTGIASGLSAVHAAGIVHRDLKPENVHVRGEHAMVLDFGIAKEVVAGPGGETIPPSLTSTGVMVGTPHYMAPEQIFGERDIDARSDVWAFGLMLYEALTGVLPTHGDGFGQVMKRITTADFPPVGAIVPGVPEALSRVVAAMLSRDRAARPSLATVASVLASPGSAPAGAPLAPPTTAPPPGVSPYASTALFVPGGSAATVPEVHPGVRVSPPPPKRGRAVLVGALGLVLLGLGGAGLAVAIVHADEVKSGLGLGPPQAPVASGRASASAKGPELDATPVALAGSTAPKSSAAPSAPGPPPPSSVTPKKPAQVPSAPAPGKPERYAAFETGVGNFNGMGPESPRLVKAVNESLPKLKTCFPAPTDEIAWSVAIRVYWPKGGGRVARVTPARNGASEAVSGESSAMVACIERMFATFSIPDATGQADNDGGASYMFTSAGYRWKLGPAPKPSGP